MVGRRFHYQSCTTPTKPVHDQGKVVWSICMDHIHVFCTNVSPSLSLNPKPKNKRFQILKIPPADATQPVRLMLRGRPTFQPPAVSLYFQQWN